MPKRSKPKAKPAKKPAAITARQLLAHVAEIQETRGLEPETIVGALCEVIATNQPTAKKAAAMLVAMLDEAGIR